jgi:glycerol-3-phosphate dehydrogenase subunit C
MGSFVQMADGEAEDRLRYQIGKCYKCGACRDLVGLSCLVFPEMFHLAETRGGAGEGIGTEELIRLVELCNFCGICPCSDLRAALLDAKTVYAKGCGLDIRASALAEFERIAKWCEAWPQLTNLFLQNPLTGRLLKQRLGIHRDRNFPFFPCKGFTAWCRERTKKITTTSHSKRKVAYFAGCTAKYLFPQVAISVVEVLERNGVQVHLPEQCCCGMPAMLEGNKPRALARVHFNVKRLLKCVEEGYDIVCSCPTCGYMLRKGLVAGSGRALRQAKGNASAENIDFPRHLIAELDQDKGYFASISQEQRFVISENIFDLGEYLGMLHERGYLDARFGSLSVETAYYAPCHLREQNLGSPYEKLLALIPAMKLESIGGSYCCGNAGIMGFKESFYPVSVRIGSRLIAKVKSINPDVVATDCLSCRMQLDQFTAYRIRHPIEIMKKSYDAYIPANGA